ncbi:50S ribosomal protein L11 methyltransferase [Clostridium chrysemydis]|uniref:50S ribosomal protein L11 methyltransferase n=1 Tax=Clostridium chrysemydis TaxID=2665504 RepID=UPI003F2E3C98
MEGTWISISVKTTSEAIEPVSGIFYGIDCNNVSVEDPNDLFKTEKGPLTWDFADKDVLEHKGEYAVVKGYFSEEDNIDSVVEFIKEKLIELKDMGIDIGLGEIEVEETKEEDWANNWKQYYKPFRVGERIVVKPIWEDYDKKPEDLVVELDPGMAFGTGDHETTSLCMKALEKYVKRDSIVFDVGCGSGILAITAAKLGAKKAIGVDLDPVAVESAKENIGYNDIDNIEILYGNLVEVIDGKADIVVANILAEIVCILTEDVRRVLKDDGYFISSGIIHERVPMVKEKLESAGFEIIEINKDGEWNAIVAKAK